MRDRQKKFVRELGAILFSLLALPMIAKAQIPTSGNVFIGYSYARSAAFTGTANRSLNTWGWEASAEGKFLPWISVVADLDWHYGSHTFRTCASGSCGGQKVSLNTSVNHILFGPRASISFGKYTPFAEVLLGVAHQSDNGGGISNSDTGFATAFGGGVDYKLIKGIALRFQGDSIHSSLFGLARNDFRLSTGVAFKF
jgi:hypothetical protein